MRPSSNILTLEAQVVGAVMGNPSFFARASLLGDEAFNDPTYRTIWSFICKAALEGKDFSAAALVNRHAQSLEPIGGLGFLSRIAAHGQEIAPSFNEAIDRLHEELQWRRINTLVAQISSVAESRDRSPDQLLSKINEITRSHLSGGRVTLRTKREVARAAIDAAREEREMTLTGIDSLDDMMQGGLQDRRLYGIGGLFGRGKTIMLGSISDHINLQNKPHLFLSLETPPEDIELRACAKHMNLNSSAIHDHGDSDHAVFVKHAETYLDAIPDATFYDYCPQATMDEIHRKILVAKARHGIKGFILDYWQLIRGRGRGQSEDDHLSDCADRLAAICRQEGLWGIVAAQVDERGRLRKSDALYQSASLYLRLVREENETRAYFVTEKSNYTRYTDNGNESVTTMVFDDAIGPHFRNTRQTDIPDLASEDEDRISLG